MIKLQLPPSISFSDIDLTELNGKNFPVYLLDKKWNYLFVNEFVKRNLGERGKDLIGKNMWQEFTELDHDPLFIKLRENSEEGRPTNFISTSPITLQRLHVTGYPLNDCYFFCTSIIPNKDTLIDELRQQLKHN